jgi:hypothetical protein
VDPASTGIWDPKFGPKPSDRACEHECGERAGRPWCSRTCEFVPWGWRVGRNPLSQGRYSISIYRFLVIQICVNLVCASNLARDFHRGAACIMFSSPLLFSTQQLKIKSPDQLFSILTYPPKIPKTTGSTERPSPCDERLFRFQRHLEF